MLFCHSHLHLGVALVLPYTCCGLDTKFKCWEGVVVQMIVCLRGLEPVALLPVSTVGPCGFDKETRWTWIWKWTEFLKNIYFYIYLFTSIQSCGKVLSHRLFFLFWDGCCSGGRAGHLPTRRLVVGSLAAPVSSLHVYVFLGKIPQFKSLSIAFISVWICESVR